MDPLRPESEAPSPLRREVEAPQRQPSGLGVLLLASAAMFFAVAGSALILRARMTREACPYRSGHPAAPLHDEIRPAGTAARSQPSGDCVREHTGPDGTQVFEFRICPE